MRGESRRLVKNPQRTDGQGYVFSKFIVLLNVNCTTIFRWTQNEDSIIKRTPGCEQRSCSDRENAMFLQEADRTGVSPRCKSQKPVLR